MMRELLGEARATVIIGLVLLVTFAAGAFYGHRVHPGETLVPADTGTPSDLPRWACRELVRERLEDYWQGHRDVERYWRRIYRFEDHPERGIVLHGDVDAMRALLGPDFGACP